MYYNNINEIMPIPDTFLPDRFAIDKIKISKINLALALKVLDEAIVKRITGYVCVTNSRASYIANQEPDYCKIQNSSLLSLPDGMPVVWIANNLGYKEVDKVSGMDLMDAVFKISVQKGYSHYFYGCSQNTIDLLQIELKSKYPGLEIKGAVSPPFQPLEEFDIPGLAEVVNKLRPTFFWCGLGAPKQEGLMALLQPYLDATISIGVGLAFEYYAGTVERAPKWMQRSGLEFSYRLIQQPRNISRAVKPLTWIFYKYLKRQFKN